MALSCAALEAGGEDEDVYLAWENPPSLSQQAGQGAGAQCCAGALLCALSISWRRREVRAHGVRRVEGVTSGLLRRVCRPPCIPVAPFLHPPCPLTMPSMLSLPLLLTLSTLPLVRCFQGTKVERVINELFEGHTLNFIECIHVDYKSSRKESFMDLQVGVGGH